MRDSKGPGEVESIRERMRERKTGQANGKVVEKTDGSRSGQVAPPSKKNGGGLGVLDILRIISGAFLLNCLLSYFITNDSMLWGYRPWFIRPKVVMRWLVCLAKSKGTTQILAGQIN